MELLEYRNSTRGHLIALENKSAMKGYLENYLWRVIMPGKNPETEGKRVSGIV